MPDGAISQPLAVQPEPSWDLGPDTVRIACEQVTEGIRYLNHATRPGAGGLTEPADVDATVASLVTAMQRLPQLLDQLRRWLDAQQDEGRLLAAYGPYQGRPAAAVAQARVMLVLAAQGAEATAQALDDAHQVTAAIGGVPGDGDDD